MLLTRFRAEGYTGWVHPDLVLPGPLISSPPRLDELPDAKSLLECEARTIVRASLSMAGAPRSFLVYQFRNGSLTRALRKSYSSRVLEAALSLKTKGFKTFEVVAALRPRGQWLNWESLVVAQEIRSVAELPSVGRHVYQIHGQAVLSLSLVRALAVELARFHDAGFAHGDLKSRHVLVRTTNGSDAAQQAFEFFFVDLEKCRTCRTLPRVLRDLLSARDLIQLLASLPATMEGRSLLQERAELLSGYFASRGMSESRKRRFESLLELYAPGGRLVQGQTVLRALLGSGGSRILR